MQLKVTRANTEMFIAQNELAEAKKNNARLDGQVKELKDQIDKMEERTKLDWNKRDLKKRRLMI
jgi:hypothetical protein